MTMQHSRRTAVLAELTRLDALERGISRRRRQLHRRIDQLYLAAPLEDRQAELLLALEKRERDISRQRRELHNHIDDVRATIGLPRWRESTDANAA